MIVQAVVAVPNPNQRAVYPAGRLSSEDDVLRHHRGIRRQKDGEVHPSTLRPDGVALMLLGALTPDVAQRRIFGGSPTRAMVRAARDRRTSACALHGLLRPNGPPPGLHGRSWLLDVDDEFRVPMAFGRQRDGFLATADDVPESPSSLRAVRARGDEPWDSGAGQPMNAAAEARLAAERRTNSPD